MSSDNMNLLDSFKVVLVEPQNPINVGTVIRAMKNMGLKHLTLVHPAEMDLQKTQISAHRTEDLLQNIQICDSLDEALQGIHLYHCAAMDGGERRGRHVHGWTFDPQLR